MSNGDSILYKPEFGFTPDHWDIIHAYVCDSGRLLLVFREGKEAAIPWIKKKFPAKPLDLKAKVDPDSGLLLARETADQAELQKSGSRFGVLVPKGGDPGNLVLRSGKGEIPNPFTSKACQGWVRPYVVVDLEAKDPEKCAVTSDYDLAAVVDTYRTDWWHVFGVSAESCQNASVSNVFVDRVTDELNKRFEDERILHGAHVQWGTGTDKDETLIFFWPNGVIQTVVSNQLNHELLIAGVVLRMHPELQSEFERHFTVH